MPVHLSPYARSTVKRTLLLSLAALMALPLVAGEAMAAPDHRGPHWRQGRRDVHVHAYKPRRRRRRRPVVVVHGPPPPPVIIVREGPPPATVMRREPARVVVKRRKKRRQRQRSLLGIGLRGVGAMAEGEKVGLSTAENPTMGGAGLQLRGRLGKSLGLELAVDVLSGQGDNFEQQTVPVTASLTYHLFPRSRLQPYVLAGGGVSFTRLKYLGGRYNIDSTELIGQLGAGLEFFLTKHISLHADLRGQTVMKNLDEQAKIRTDCLNRVGDMVGFCDGINAADPDDKVNLGLQLQAGASWYF